MPTPDIWHDEEYRARLRSFAEPIPTDGFDVWLRAQSKLCCDTTCTDCGDEFYECKACMPFCACRGG